MNSASPKIASPKGSAQLPQVTFRCYFGDLAVTGCFRFYCRSRLLGCTACFGWAQNQRTAVLGWNLLGGSC
jgi:hypothetical protein